MVIETSPPRRRIELVDCARGLALVAMAIYHFTWDLDFFGYIEPGSSVTGGWRIFARCIAISFLFIVGVSLYLANGHGIRWKSYWRRLAMITAAALAVTAATIVVTPGAFIFFGILHHIAVASLLGLLFLRLHWAVIILSGIIAVVLPHVATSAAFNHPVLWWIGLSTEVAPSTDFVPLFPMFGAVLFGIAAAKVSEGGGLTERLAGLTWPKRIPLLGFFGKHSLAFYLLHQPVLISIVWVFAQVLPPPPPDQGALFLSACNVECVAFREEPFCNAYCSCLLDKAKANKLADQLFGPDEATTERLRGLANMCLIENTPGEGLAPAEGSRSGESDDSQ